MLTGKKRTYTKQSEIEQCSVASKRQKSDQKIMEDQQIKEKESTFNQGGNFDEDYDDDVDDDDVFDSEDEKLDFTFSIMKAKGGRKLIKNQILQYFQEQEIDFNNSRNEKLRSYIRSKFKFGSRVKNYIYCWIKNKKKNFKSLQIAHEIKNENIDPIIKKLFSESHYVSNQHINILTSILDKYIPVNIRQFYYDKELKNIKDLISNQECLGNIQVQILSLPKSVQIQAMILLFNDSINNEKIANIIENILIPILQQDLPLMCLDKNQISLLYTHIKDIDISRYINEDSAKRLITLFYQGKIIDYDFIRKNCQSLKDQFWHEVFDILQISQNLQALYFEFRKTLFTNSIKNYIDTNLLNYEFIKTLSKFQILTEQQILELSQHQRDINYNKIIKLVNTTLTYNEYLQKMKPFVTFQGEISVELFNILSKNPVFKWDSYHSLLKSNLIDTDKSCNIIKESIKNCFDMMIPAQKLPNKIQVQVYEDKLSKEIKKFSNKFRSFMNLEWQRYLILSIYHLVISQEKKSIQIKLPTGHGKSIIIQLLAQMFQGRVLIVCLNTFLTFYARQLYYIPENQNIRYISLNEFLRMVPQKDTLIIIDEIDIISGCNSFYIDNFNKKQTCYFLMDLLKGYQTWIGFSATFSLCGRELSKITFKDSIYLNIKSVNEQVGENSLTNHKIFNNEKEKFQQIESIISEQKEIYKNFIVIMENKEESNRFFELFKKPQDKKVLLINEVNKFQETLGKIQGLMASDFIIITIKELGIGVDFRGTDIAHVIIAFKYQNYSELKQALGRGSRDVNKRCTGTLLTSKELPCEIEYLIENEKFDDQRKSQNLLHLQKVAQILHRKDLLTDKQNDIVQQFQTRMQKGWNFFNEENVEDETGFELFDNLQIEFDQERKYLKDLNTIDVPIEMV